MLVLLLVVRERIWDSRERIMQLVSKRRIEDCARQARVTVPLEPFRKHVCLFHVSDSTYRYIFLDGGSYADLRFI